MESFKMIIKNNDEIGSIYIQSDVVATLAGMVCEKCYGVVGLAARNAKDGVASILTGGNIKKGVTVTADDGGIVVELRIIAEYGTNITAVCKSIANRVRYSLSEYAGINVKRVNVKVEDIRTE